MKRDQYFFFINSFLLLIVLIGFAPSFYMRPFSEQDSLPLYLIVHGCACTTWFFAAFLQSLWITQKKIKRHRSLGLYFALLAPMISLSGYWVIYYRISDYFAQTNSQSTNIPEFQLFESMLIWGDSLVLISFAFLVYLGYASRKNSQSHKRWMLFASVMIVPQAFVRIGKFELLQIGTDPGISGSIYAVAGPVLILLSLVGYDLYSSKKVHRTTTFSLIWYVALLVSSVIMMRSGIAVALLELIRWTS